MLTAMESERGHLVFSLLLEQQDAILKFDKQTTKNMLLASKQSYINDCIQKNRNRHYTIYLYEKLFNKVKDHAYALYYAAKNSQIYELECDILIEYITTICKSNPDIQDNLSRYISAQYKEKLYNILDYGNTEIQGLILKLFERAFFGNLTVCKYVSEHNPSYYIFDGLYFQFYEILEKHKKDIELIYKQMIYDDDVYE